MHNENDKTSTYYSEEKFQYDYSSILECKPSHSEIVEIPNYWKFVEQGYKVWDIPHQLDPYEEDNDTSESDDDAVIPAETLKRVLEKLKNVK